MKPTDEQILRALRSDKWRQCGSAVIAEHIGCSASRLHDLRKEHGLMPEFVKCRNGRVIRITNIGHGGGPRRSKLISDSRKKLIEQCEQMVDNFSSRCSNQTLDKDELRIVAEDAVISASKTWRKRLGLPWQFYAYRAIDRDIRRAFASRRNKMVKEGLFKENDEHRQYAMDQLTQEVDVTEPQILKRRFDELRGIKKLTAIWLCGIDGCKRRDAAAIAEYLGVNQELASQIVEDTRDAMAD